MQDNEIWKDISGWPSYQVSESGRVRTVGRKVRTRLRKFTVNPHELSTAAHNGKYRYVTFQIKNKRANHYIHRLVAGAFCKKPSRLHIEVNHIDGNKFNNHYTNLEWVTLQENRDHAVNTNLMCHGEKSPQSTLKEFQVLEILNAFIQDPKQSKLQVAQRYGIRDTTVHKILHGQRWRRAYKKWASDHGVDITEFKKSFRIYKSAQP